jgi:hypothetical protein
LRFAEACLAKVASLGKSTIAAWWLAILTVGALAGIFYHGTRGHDDLCAPASAEVL